MANLRLTFLRVLLIHEFPMFIAILVCVLFGLWFSSLIKDTPTYILFSSTLLFVGIAVSIKQNVQRHHKIKSIMEYGHKRTGHIVEKYSRWNWGYVVYEYKYKGQIYRNSEYVPVNPFLKPFKLGQEITIFVNKKSLSHSIFYELYF